MNRNTNMIFEKRKCHRRIDYFYTNERKSHWKWKRIDAKSESKIQFFVYKING